MVGCNHKKTTKDFAAVKFKDKTRVSVRSQKQESDYMCIVVYCIGNYKKEETCAGAVNKDWNLWEELTSGKFMEDYLSMGGTPCWNTGSV